MMVEHNQSANNPTNGGYNNAYKFNGKELDDAIQMYYYDPRISIFVSVDPLAEKTMTPYQYVSNNPIMRIDPTGMNDHDYKINKDTGELTLIKETNTPDRVFNDEGKFVELEYNGQVEDMKKFGNTTYSKFSDKSKATEAFEFFASNSVIEWGQVNTPTNSYVLNSGGDTGVNVSGFAYSFFLSQGKDVTDINHSHPIHAWGAETPSDYGHNPTKNNMYSERDPYHEPNGDYSAMHKLIYGWSQNGVEYKGYGDKARNINYRVFNTVDKTYIQYDENKAVKLVK